MVAEAAVTKVGKGVVNVETTAAMGAGAPATTAIVHAPTTMEADLVGGLDPAVNSARSRVMKYWSDGIGMMRTLCLKSAMSLLP